MWWGLLILFSQVRGIVLDQETKDPVIGAAVSDLRGHWGTYSDLNGNFLLQSASLGDTLVVTHVSYRAETLVIRQSFITIYLERSYITTPPVTVRESPWERRLKTTATVYSKQGEDLEALGWEDPWEGIASYPGVIQGHIRGGRRGEVLYTLDGAPIVDNVQREVVFELPTWAISRMELLTSGFEPEYGNVTSGLLQLTSKKMNLREEAHVYVRTDLSTPPIGDPYREVRVGGFYSTRRGFLSIRGVGSGTRFWNLWRHDFSYPIRASVDYLGNWTLSLPSGFLVFQALGALSRWREYEHLWRFYLRGLPLRQRESHRFGILFSSKLGERWGFDFTGFDYIMNYQVLGKSTREYDLHFEFDSLGYVERGDKPVWTDRFQNRLFLKAKFHYFTPRFQGYVGAEINRYDLYVREVQLYPDYIEGYNFLAFLTYLNRYHYRPWSQALFFSWKFKNGPDLVHFGLRYDRFDPRSYRPAVEIPHEWPPPDWVYEPQDSVPASPKAQWSPRIGISHRAKNVIIRFNYGEYFQIPEFQYLYSNPFYNFHRGYMPLVGNPDLKPSRTRLYEYSVILLPRPDENISLNVFYRESDHLVDALRIIPDTSSFTDLATGFTVYEDIGEAVSVGFECAWEGYRPGFQWTLSYTLMKAMGTYGTWLENRIEAVEGVVIEPDVRYPLSWDQRHTLAFEGILGDPKDRYVALSFQWGSGFPYSPRGGPPNSKRLPPNYQLTLRAGYRWRNLLFHFRVENPFDHRNILWVDVDGRPGGLRRDPTAFSEGRRVWFEATVYF